MSTQLANNGHTFLTVPEIAHLMGVSQNKAKEWARTGEFGAFKQGTSYVFPSERLEMLSVEEVAALLRVNVQTVRRWAREGTYPAIKVGRRYYFSRSKLLANA